MIPRRQIISDPKEQELRRCKLLLSFSEGREAHYKKIIDTLLKGLDSQLSSNIPDYFMDTLTSCLHKLISFEHLTLLTMHDLVWETIYTSSPVLDGMILAHGSHTKRVVLDNHIAAFYSPLELPEFSGVTKSQRKFLASAIMMSFQIQDSFYLFLFSSSTSLTLDLTTKSLLRTFRPIILDAIQRYHSSSGLYSEIFAVTTRYSNNLDRVKKFIEVSNIAYWRTDENGFFERDLDIWDSFRISRHLQNIGQSLFMLNLLDLPNIYEMGPEFKNRHKVKTMKDIFASRENIYKYITVVTSMGQDYYLCLNGEPVMNSSGEFGGYLGTFTDITADVRFMQTLEGEKEISEQVSASKSKFLAMMSHEIKTPMQAIIGILDLLALTELTDEQKKLIQHITHSANLLQMLLKDVLDYSRMGSNEMRLEELEFSVRFVMDSIIKQMMPKAKEQGIKLKLDVSSNFPTFIIGDQNRLSQVIFNLLGNAIKFTQYGEVKLKAYVQKNKSLRFEISDTGIGIAPDKVQSLFNPFKQVDESMTRRFGGTGLGLAICKKIIELMNGTIGVESTLGAGSTFWFVIPPKLPSRDASIINVKSIVKTDHKNSEERKYRILLAEDSKVNQFIIKKMLENLGHQVTLADNGLMAVEQVEQDEPDLVLMDLQMPELNGIDATRRIIRYHPLLIVLALTANVSQEERIECRDAGMLDVVSKPVTIESLKTMFQTFRTEINYSIDERKLNAKSRGYKDNTGAGASIKSAEADNPQTGSDSPASLDPQDSSSQSSQSSSDPTTSQEPQSSSDRTMSEEMQSSNAQATSASLHSSSDSSSSTVSRNRKKKKNES